MRKIILGLALALLLLPTPGLAGGLAPSGTIIDNQGQQITVERFDKLMGSYPFVYEDSESKVPMSDVGSLTYNNDNTVTLVTTKGKSFNVTGQMGVCYTDMISYQTKNPIDGSLQAQTIDPFLVRKIIFDWKKK
ncbi:MAG: hypothetical protein K9K65_18220 [Desulfarculaceae bacterium]|nr:hypothetical protein [Desulfarculaceae bacterium]MCF8047792.1 hypothetical protein [Desulfarculaceae bacterium]MCF8064926.1 hypothetical protein [Desulfarculaceae bacterium]MCF8099781.1 hypothetical protein [Desulfarculaceae bacterium]MCF8122975.1 hypothetical protein [Desulfarculaceae bacterium]